MNRPCLLFSKNKSVIYGKLVYYGSRSRSVSVPKTLSANKNGIPLINGHEPPRLQQNLSLEQNYYSQEQSI